MISFVLIWWIISEFTVEPLLTDTSLIRTPLYYGQFPWSRQNQCPYNLYKENFYNRDTSLIRTPHHSTYHPPVLYGKTNVPIFTIIFKSPWDKINVEIWSQDWRKCGRKIGEMKVSKSQHCIRGGEGEVKTTTICRRKDEVSQDLWREL